MLRILGRISVKQRILLGATLSGGVALVLVAGMLIAFHLQCQRQEVISMVETQAALVSASCIGPMSVLDKHGAEDVLGALHVDKSVLVCRLFDMTGEEFASWRSSGVDANQILNPGEPGYSIRGDKLTLTSLVTKNGEMIGHLVVLYDLSYLQTGLYRFMGITAIALMAVLILSIVINTFVARGITGPMVYISHAMDTATEEVFTSANQMADTANCISQDASSQAASLEQTSASLREIRSQTQSNASNSSKARTLVKQVEQASGEGENAMERLDVAIEKIKTSSDDSARIIQTIDDIAFQTNLLALNAAVEAARAGDAGRGFAVVADEVRNLAQRSTEAARGTADLIDEAQSNADDGVVVSTEVGRLLHDIVTGVGEVGELISQIANAGRDQAAGIDQIMNAVEHLERVTQSNAANSEESAAVSEHLLAQSRSMRRRTNQMERLLMGRSQVDKPVDEQLRKPQRKAVVEQAASIAEDPRPVMRKSTPSCIRSGDSPETFSMDDTVKMLDLEDLESIEI